MKLHHIILFFLFLGITLQSCDSDGNQRLSGEAPEEVEFEVKESRINLPIQIPLAEIETAINRKIPETIVKAHELRKGVSLVARRKDYILLSGSGTKLIWKVPIEIEIHFGKKDKELSTFSLTPTFSTEIKLNSDYTLNANSVLESVEWIEPATVSILGIEIDLTPSVEETLFKKKDVITDKIDDEIEKISLEKLLEKTWQKLLSPIRMNKSLVKIFVIGKPSEAELHSYYLDQANLNLDLTLHAQLNTVYDSAAHIPKNFQYPPLALKQKTDEGFEVHLPLLIEYALIDSLTNALATKKAFMVEGEEIKLDSIHISARDSFLVIYSKLTGDWNAEMEVYGIPSYNPSDKSLSINGFDFFIKEESNSIFHATDYFFHEEIQNEILEYLNFPVGHLIDTLPQVLYHSVEKGKAGDKINLTNSIDSLSVSEISIGKNALGIQLYGKGKALLEVEKIKSQ